MRDTGRACEMLGKMRHNQSAAQHLALVVAWLDSRITIANKRPMCHHIPIDISGAVGLHRLVHLLGKKEFLVPGGQVAYGIGSLTAWVEAVFRHPGLLAHLQGLGSHSLHVLERWVAIEMTTEDVNMFG